MSDLLQLTDPRKPQLPLIVWMVRKMLDRSSCEYGSVSSFTSSLSSRSRFSLLSTRNSLIRSSIAPPYLRYPVLGAQRHGAVGHLASGDFPGGPSNGHNLAQDICS